MTATVFAVDAFDGHRIHVRRWDPAGSPRAVALVAHGMAEHGDRYAPLGEFLAARGIVTYALDHRGHGKSARHEEDLGHYADATKDIDGWARVVDDVSRVILHARGNHPGLPLALIGHSMGSFIAQAVTIAHGDTIDALALSGSNYDPPLLYRVARLLARLEKFRQGPRGRSALLEFLSFGAFNKPFRPARTAYDWLSRDPAEVDKYVADTRCGFRVTNQLWVDLLGGLAFISTPANLARLPSRIPVYLLGGDRDPVGKSGKGLPRLAEKLRAAGIGSVTLKLYRDGRHEMFNETNRAEVFADLYAWLESALGK